MQKKIYLVTFFLSIFLSALVIFAENSIPFFELINSKGRDFYFQIRHSFVHLPNEPNEILLVSIDDESLKRLEGNWPFPRSIYTEAIERLKPFAPKVIGFDLIFSGKDLVPENDILFASALKDAGNIVIASHQSSVGEIGPEKMIGSNVWQVGIVDKPRDPDHVIRQSLFSFPVSGTILPSWEVAVFEKAFGSSSFKSSKKFIIDYRLKHDEFSHVSFWRLLEGSVLASELHHKIILIGPTAEVFHDLHATPLGLMPGIAINANVLSMLMNRTFFSFPPQWFSPSIYFFSIWLVMLFGWSFSLRKGLFMTLLLSTTYLLFGFLMFRSYVVIDFWFLAFSLFAFFAVTTFCRHGYFWFLNDQLKRESKRDPLTGFYSEKFLHLKLRSVNQNLILLMIKIDQLSDTEESSRLILSIANRILSSSVRKNEIVCQYDNGLYVIVLPHANVNDAVWFGEKIRRIAGEQADFKSQGKITFSIAVAFPPKGKSKDSESLLEVGKRLLQKAHSEGGNRVIYN